MREAPADPAAPSPDDRWLAAMWPRVRSHLPAPPAAVVEIGCGHRGGFVSMLAASGYQALGVDPKAPEGASFRRVEFEHCELPSRADALVACTSLHHVAEPGVVVDKMAGSLRPGGVAIVVEWDWESFDEATARWGFDRLDPSASGGWLVRRREGWMASRQPWMSYLRAWAAKEGLHSGEGLIRELDRRFHRRFRDRGPYLFADLPGTSEAEELRAIEKGEIRAMRIEYAGVVT